MAALILPNVLTPLLAAASRASHGAKVFDVLAYGAKADGVTNDAAAITKAYAACRAANGGTVVFAGGRTFRTGPISLGCNHSVTLLQPGAVLLSVLWNSTAVAGGASAAGQTAAAAGQGTGVAGGTTWPFGPDCPEPSQGKTPRQMAPLVLVSHGVNMTVKGGGALDAAGQQWWEGACGNWWCPPGSGRSSHGSGAAGPLAFRPFLFRIDHSTDVRLENISLRNSGFWTLVPVRSRRLRFLGLTITAQRSRLDPRWPADRPPDLFSTPNTDGIEPMHSSDVYISGCWIKNGDDCITVKSGSSNVLVEDLYCEHGDGLTIGSIWYDDVINVTYRRVLMNRTHNGPMIKGRSQGNATVRDVTFEDIVLEEVYLGLTIDCDYETAGTVEPNIGVLATDITFRNITGTVVLPRLLEQQQQSPSQQQRRHWQRWPPALGASGHDPSMLVDAAGTFVCRPARPCVATIEGVHLRHANAANTSAPEWLCNGSVISGVDVLPRLPSACNMA